MTENTGGSKLYEKALAYIRGLGEASSFTPYIQRVGADKSTFYKVLAGKQTNAENFLAWLERLGVGLSFPEEGAEASRPVVFGRAAQVSAHHGAPPPAEEDYIAVPLAAGPVAAGRGMIPAEEVRSWVLVWKNHDSVRFRRNLIAVEIARGMTSMVPTLHPQDICLVDRDDFHTKFDPPGNIFLVREPDDSVAVKRVVLKVRGGETHVTFYSDNVTEHPPQVYSLAADYGGDIAKAIIGRVVWAWSDMSRK